MRIDLPYGAGMPKRSILVTCGSALSQLWRPVRRDARGSRAFRGQRGVGGKVAAALVSAEERRPEAARGGSVSPLEEFAVEILDLIAQRPDLTLVETVAELRKRRIKTSRSSLWRFLDRDTNITLKKVLRQPNGSEQMWRERAAAGYESKVCLIRWLVFIDETAVSTNMVRPEGGKPAWRPPK